MREIMLYYLLLLPALLPHLFMQQAELILLIGRLTDRVLSVESAVDMLKTQQKDHDGQIEAVALELHDFRGEMYGFRDEMYVFRDEMYAFRTETNTRFDGVNREIIGLKAQIQFLHTRMDNGFTRMDDEFRQIRKVLARLLEGQTKTG